MKNKSNIKFMLAIIINFLIVVLEIIGGIYFFKTNKPEMALQYYTQNSNNLALIVSSIFCATAIICLIKKTQLPKFIYYLRFISTCCLTVTLFVVLAILIPILSKNAFVDLMLTGSGLYHHLLCPLLSILSFVFLENQIKLTKKCIILALVPTTIYGTTCVILNILKVITGPYPFFYVYLFPWYVCSGFILLIYAVSVFIAFMLYKTFNRKQKLQYFNAN